MARPGISKHEVQKARLALVRAGKHPSIDAIRIELGNTGSKATIFRYLKEIEADEGGSGLPKASISDELLAFVSNLAARLEFESQERIEALKASHTEEARRLNEALAKVRNEAKAARGEAERSQVQFDRERIDRQRVAAELDALRLEHSQTTAQLSTRLTAVQEQLKSAEAHAASLEEKHAHARESLEHFRNASKEQRDREARQHELQIQYLQREVATAAEALTAKQTELRSALQEKAEALALLTSERAEKRQIEEQLRELKPTAERLATQIQVVSQLRSQAEQASQLHETVRTRASDLERRNMELERLLAAASASAHAQEVLVKGVLERIGNAHDGGVPARSRTKPIAEK